MDLTNIIFYSVPVADAQRHVVFSLPTPSMDMEDLAMAWNNPAHGHIFTMSIYEQEICIGNYSNEDVILFAFNQIVGASYVVGRWAPSELKMVTSEMLLSGGSMADVFVVLKETPVFNITAYLHRKKAGMHYSRQDTVSLPSGVYFGLGGIAASLNDSVKMRGERNGFIYHFITRKGKICIESSHRQPDPSFLEIVPLVTSLGMPDTCTLRLRTKERIDFDYGVCPIIY